MDWQIKSVLSTSTKLSTIHNTCRLKCLPCYNSIMTTQNIACPKCMSTNTEEITYETVAASNKGETLVTGLKRSICRDCDIVFFSPDQEISNAQVIENHKKSVGKTEYNCPFCFNWVLFSDFKRHQNTHNNQDLREMKSPDTLDELKTRFTVVGLYEER